MQTLTPSRRTKRRYSVEALASTLVNSSVCYETDKKARRVRVQRLPTAYLLPIVAQTEIRHIPFKRQLGQNTLLLVAEKVNCRVSRPMFTLPKAELGVGIAAAFDTDTSYGRWQSAAVGASLWVIITSAAESTL